ncbi:MAG TPA: DUF4270 family protein [Bacteroidales bacterium]|nr:DUF4270 family protein [Bacteroidales bacterium]
MTRYYHSSQSLHRFYSVSHHLFSKFFLTLFTLITFFLSSCEEEPTQIGSALLPKGDFVDIQSTDTISAWSYTMYDELDRTDNPSISYLGYIYDPYFGTTTAEFVTEIRMGSEWNFEPTTIDSVRLYLTLLDVKGGGSDNVYTLKLSEIAEQLNIDSAYYSSKVVPLTGYEISDIELPALTPDTINNIVIDLPVEFGNYLIRDTSKLFYSNTRDDFRSFFNGLYFSITPGSDPLLVLLSFTPPSTPGAYNNVLVLYMHDEADELKQFLFILDAVNKNASFNKYSHDFTTASPEKKIAHINDGFLDTLSYLQSLNGVYTKIELPSLKTLKDDPAFNNIGVNKARLSIPVYLDGDMFKPSTVPPQLYLRYRTKSGAKYEVPDYYIDKYHDFFDGRIDSINNVYKFNLATFVQGYFNDATDEVLPELELFQYGGIKNVILKANNSKTPVKFEYTYTKF